MNTAFKCQHFQFAKHEDHIILDFLRKVGYFFACFVVSFCQCVDVPVTYVCVYICKWIYTCEFRHMEASCQFENVQSLLKPFTFSFYTGSLTSSDVPQKCSCPCLLGFGIICAWMPLYPAFHSRT